jgi:hypothetical protein
LGGGVRERRQLLEEARAHVLLGQRVEQLLHGACVAGSSRAYADLAAVSQSEVVLLRHGIGGPAPQQLARGDESPSDRALEQRGPIIGMGDLHECHDTFGERRPNRYAVPYSVITQ